MSTLTSVNRQWANRPADETFETIDAALSAARAYAAASHEKADVIPSTLRTEAVDGSVMLTGRGNRPAYLTNWAFGQLAGLGSSPASFLRELPATLTAQILNNRLKEKYGTPDAPKDVEERVNLLLTGSSESLVVRSINSDIYSRIWNYELLERARELTGYGWHNPAPFNSGSQVGTVWVSDHDMFLFQVNDSNLIKVPGEDRYLRRGYTMSNSEVGGGKWKTASFLFDYMCANRLVWGVQNFSEVSVRHVGSASDRVDDMFRNFVIAANRYANSSGNTEEGRIEKARSYIIAATKTEVIEKVFRALRGDITRKALESGYDTAVNVPDTTASPNSAWALAQGITRYSQGIAYTDERMKLDRAAGKIVELAQASF